MTSRQVCPTGTDAGDLDEGTLASAGRADRLRGLFDYREIAALRGILDVATPARAEIAARVAAIDEAQEEVMAGGGRSPAADMRRELTQLLRGFPDLPAGPLGLDADILGRYRVARSSARALSVEDRGADTVDARMRELSDAWIVLRAAVRHRLTAVTA